ncbi:hypothetical protein HK105_202393 [Polyrhizophydium stewartii]|uniref:Uncharacterized protein n=1 Tax=Polyrhizophydium stewartii TaxID=2732419 RepID=A0ABR4NEL9_9FUNG
MHARIAAIKNTFLRRSYEADHVQRVSEEALYSISAWLTALMLPLVEIFRRAQGCEGGLIVSDIIAKIDLPTYEWAVKKMEKNYAHASKKVCRARTSLHAIEVKIAGLEDQLAASSSNPRNIKSIEKKIKALRAKEFKAMAKYKLRMAQLDKASDSLMSATTMCDRAKAVTEWLATFAATDASATTTTTSTTAPTASNTPSARRSMIDRIKSAFSRRRRAPQSSATATPAPETPSPGTPEAAAQGPASQRPAQAAQPKLSEDQRRFLILTLLAYKAEMGEHPELDTLASMIIPDEPQQAAR